MPVFSFQVGEAIDDIVDFSYFSLLAVHMFSNKYNDEANKLINRIKRYNDEMKILFDFSNNGLFDGKIRK